MKGVEEGRKVALEMTHEIEKEALQEFKDKGLEIVEITPEQRQVQLMQQRVERIICFKVW